jgi:hypothetical protein
MKIDFNFILGEWPGEIGKAAAGDRKMSCFFLSPAAVNCRRFIEARSG